MEDKYEYLIMMFLTNKYPSLEGLEFRGYKLINAGFDWFRDWFSEDELNGHFKRYHFYDNQEYCTLFYKKLYKLEKKILNEFEVSKSFNIAMHIYCNTDIYIKQFIYAKRINGIPQGTSGDGSPDIYGFHPNSYEDCVLKDSHNIQLFLDKFNIDDFNPTLEAAINFFYLCLQNNDNNLRFVLLISILEILFSPTDSKTELKYRSTRNAAIFLGKSIDECRHIFKRLGNFYDFRSSFIHQGKSSEITNETLYELSEYVRQILKNMIIKKDIIGGKKTYTNLLNESAFGSNPYNID